MRGSCEDCQRLRRDRARHLVLLLAFVDIVEDFRTGGGTGIYKRSAELLALCKNEMLEGRREL